MKTIEIMRLETGFSLYTDARTMKYRTERGIFDEQSIRK